MAKRSEIKSVEVDGKYIVIVADGVTNYFTMYDKRAARHLASIIAPVPQAPKKTAKKGRR